MIVTQRSGASESSLPTLTCYSGNLPLTIRRAPRRREWFDPPAQSAKKCLPLLMANSAGWEILNPASVTVTWDGRSGLSSLQITGEAGIPYVGPASSLFGSGILSFQVSGLFRTSPGWNLLVRGPANRPKDGVAPLEGLVETDWSVSTFTMNWKLTRAGLPVTFSAGEPFCMVVPQPRGMLERIVPARRRLSSRTEPGRGVRQFLDRRRAQQQQQFLAEQGVGQAPAFDLRYFRGRLPDNRRADEHQTALHLRDFPDEDEPD